MTAAAAVQLVALLFGWCSPTLNILTSCADDEAAQLRKRWKSGCEPVHGSIPGLLQQLPFSHIVLF